MKNEVEALRRTAGISQEALAAAMGVSRQTISSIEHGRYNPSITLAIRLARYFGRHAEDVFFVDGKNGWRMADELLAHPNMNAYMKNYRINSDFLMPDDFLYAQSSPLVSRFRLGGFGAGFNGAVPVALYNMHRLLSEKCEFADILLEFEGNDAVLLAGFGGVDPRQLGGYLLGHRLSYRYYESPSTFAEQEETSESIFIVSYWKDKLFRELKGLHTVAGIYRDGKWSVYNTGEDTTKPTEYADFDAFMHGRRYFAGYIIEGRMEDPVDAEV